DSTHTAGPERIAATVSLIQSVYKKDGDVLKNLKTDIDNNSPAAQNAFDVFVASTVPLFGAIITDDNPGEAELLAKVMVGISQLLKKYLDLVDREKWRRQVLDFDDLLLQANKLLQDSPMVLSALRKKYRWILVDEFQDTNTIQSEIIEQIAGDKNNLFLVGDPKQSIYGFRQADVSIFNEYLQKIPRQDTAQLPFEPFSQDDPGESTEQERRGVIGLPDNFRSAGKMIHFFNHLFEKVMQKETEFDVDFAPLNPQRKSPPGFSPQIELHLFECDDSLIQENYLPHENAEIIKIIQSLVQGGDKFKVIDWENQLPLDYRDIAILTRDRKRWPLLSGALREAGIPFELYRGTGFFQTQEVQDMYYLLKAIGDPEDNFAVIAALRSPYIGVSDAGLFYLSRCRGENYSRKLTQMAAYLRNETPGNTFEEKFLKVIHAQNIQISIGAEDRQALLRAAALLPRWQLSAHRTKFSTLLAELIETLNVRAVLRQQEFGGQKIANLGKLIKYAYAYEQKSSMRISDFLDSLWRLIKGGGLEGEASLVEETANQVRVLTIHSAKGLEFPVVIIPFMENRFNFKEDIYFHKKDGILLQMKSLRGKSFAGKYFKEMYRQQTIAEEKRLFYVAATRAKDHLFFVGANGFKGQSQVSFLKWLLSLPGNDATGADYKELLSEKFGIIVEHQSITGESLTPVFTDFAAGPRPWERGEESLPAREMLMRYAKPLALPAAKGEYSATQLMIYRENPERYVHHFYLKGGVIYPPHLAVEYSDEPGG
ncbi:MAG: UvrD-helicase domain-containing protein, partial [Calditrichia bacterium]